MLALANSAWIYGVAALASLIIWSLIKEIDSHIAFKRDRTRGRRLPADDPTFPGWTEREMYLWRNRPKQSVARQLDGTTGAPV
jgi:hypothetical protein